MHPSVQCEDLPERHVHTKPDAIRQDESFAGWVAGSTMGSAKVSAHTAQLAKKHFFLRLLGIGVQDGARRLVVVAQHVVRRVPLRRHLLLARHAHCQL